jgi:catechol 2,3-dioxygenase-like lactoylglutathione lyase family enzyme
MGWQASAAGKRSPKVIARRSGRDSRLGPYQRPCLGWCLAQPSTAAAQPPRDPDLASSFLNIRVSDIHAVYAEWSARGAAFLTPPKQHKTELRCYVRDPDGHLIEVGQTTLPGGWRQFLNP